MRTDYSFIMGWKFKVGNKVEAKKSICTVDELADEINKIVGNAEFSQQLATELLVKVFTEKKETLEEFMQKHKDLDPDKLQKIINIANSKLQGDL